MSSPPRLSVIVICRNQRLPVLRCVTSVLRETSSLVEGREIIVVDSASTDGTREALAGLPVRWVGIGESPLLCASLGRWTGSERAVGDYVMFLDGDMELLEGFVPAALAALERIPRAAGIIGQVLEANPSFPGASQDIHRIAEDSEAEGVTGKLFAERPANRGRRDVFRITGAGPAARFGGAVLFRRRSLTDAGGFDPYIFNREENELYSRIRKRREVVYQLPIPMAIHHDPPCSPAEKLLREILPGRKRPLGRAQAFLRSLKKGNLLSYVRQEWLFFFSLIADIASVAFLLLLRSSAAWGPLISVQLASMAVHTASWSAGQYVLNKVAAVQFSVGLIVAPALLRRPLPVAWEAP